MWYAGAYTAQMDMVPVGVASCFTKPVIFDGAKRDRAIWSGDLMVSDPVALLSLGSNAAPYVTGSIDAFIDLQVASGRLTSAVGFRGCGAFDYAVTYSATRPKSLSSTTATPATPPTSPRSAAEPRARHGVHGIGGSTPTA